MRAICMCAWGTDWLSNQYPSSKANLQKGHDSTVRKTKGKGRTGREGEKRRCDWNRGGGKVIIGVRGIGPGILFGRMDRRRGERWGERSGGLGPPTLQVQEASLAPGDGPTLRPTPPPPTEGSITTHPARSGNGTGVWERLAPTLLELASFADAKKMKGDNFELPSLSEHLKKKGETLEYEDSVPNRPPSKTSRE